MSDIPLDFIRTTLEVHGVAGAEWLEHLPGLLTECAERWSLTIEAPFIPLTYNYVAPATRADRTQVVLKAGVPSRELKTEIEALRLFAGHGTVRLLDADSDKGTLLLERLEPGSSLLTVAEDAQASAIAAEVMRKLWRPSEGHSFPSVADWMQGLDHLRQRFGGGTGPLPTRLVEEAETTFTDLMAAPEEMVLLHGDLHHGNILTAERSPWLAIDPKGVVGERAFEPSASLLNPGPQTREILRTRVEIFAEMLGLSRERIRAWGMVRAILSAWWSMEDHGAGGEDAVMLAERLREGALGD